MIIDYINNTLDYIHFNDTLSTKSTLYAIVPAIILVIGIPANTLSMIIWFKRISSTPGSTSLFIGIMCLTDTYVLAHGCFRQWIIGLTNERIDIRVIFGCQLPLFLFTFATDLSTWIIILLCIERAICVWFPVKFKSWCQLKHGTIALIVVSVNLIFINVHYFFTVQLQNNNCLPNTYFHDFLNYWPYIDLAVYSFIPLAFILLVNGSILWRIKTTKIGKNYKQNFNLSNNNSNNAIVKTNDQIKVTNRSHRSAKVLRTVICMTISHFVLTTPVVLYFLVESKVCVKDDQWIQHCDLIERLTITLQMINHMTHFFIYSCTSTVFLFDLQKLCSQLKLDSINNYIKSILMSCNIHLENSNSSNEKRINKKNKSKNKNSNVENNLDTNCNLKSILPTDNNIILQKPIV